MALMFAFSMKKAMRITDSFSYDLKKKSLYKKEASVIYIHLLTWKKNCLFLGKERMISLNLYIRVETPSWYALHVCKTLYLFVNFSINTAYKQPVLLKLRLMSWNFGKSGRDGKQ